MNKCVDVVVLSNKMLVLDVRFCLTSALMSLNERQ